MSSCGLQTGLRLLRSLQFRFLSHIVQSGLSILAATGVFLMGSWVLFPATQQRKPSTAALAERWWTLQAGRLPMPR